MFFLLIAVEFFLILIFDYCKEELDDRVFVGLPAGVDKHIV